MKYELWVLKNGNAELVDWTDHEMHPDTLRDWALCRIEEGDVEIHDEDGRVIFRCGEIDENICNIAKACEAECHTHDGDYSVTISRVAKRLLLSERVVEDAWNKFQEETTHGSR